MWVHPPIPLEEDPGQQNGGALSLFRGEAGPQTIANKEAMPNPEFGALPTAQRPVLYPAIRENLWDWVISL